MATWIAPKTFVTGDNLAFDELNAAMGDLGDLQWLKNALAAVGVTADSGNQTLNSALRGMRVVGGQQEIPSGVWTAVSWTSQRFGRAENRDQNYLYSEHPEAVRLPYAFERFGGWWAIGCHIAFKANTTGRRGLRIGPTQVFNGMYSILATTMEAATAGGVTQELSVSSMGMEDLDGFLPIVAGDSFMAEVYQDSGDTLTLVSVPGTSPELWACQVGSSFGPL